MLYIVGQSYTIVSILYFDLCKRGLVEILPLQHSRNENARNASSAPEMHFRCSLFTVHFLVTMCKPYIDGDYTESTIVHIVQFVKLIFVGFVRSRVFASQPIVFVYENLVWQKYNIIALPTAQPHLLWYYIFFSPLPDPVESLFVYCRPTFPIHLIIMYVYLELSTRLCGASKCLSYYHTPEWQSFDEIRDTNIIIV